MFKRLRIIELSFTCLVILGFSLNVMHAQEPSNSLVESKKYNLSICAIFRDEAKYLKEWLEYHKMIGVEHFYLYNNGSADSSIKVLTPYIKEGLVTLIYWPDRLPNYQMEDTAAWVLTTQAPAYENVAKYLALKDTKWLVVLEVDEFLVPVNTRVLSEVLNSYDEYPGLQVLCDFFDASSNENIIPRRNLLIETVELAGVPEQKIEKSVEKIIFKPECYTSFTWPPYKCNFKDNKAAIKLSKNELRINKYANRSKGALLFGKIKDKLHVDNRTLSYEEILMVLENGFEIEDQERVIQRFVPELRKRMNFETGWDW